MSADTEKKYCYFWHKGNCIRENCTFLHETAPDDYDFGPVGKKRTRFNHRGGRQTRNMQYLQMELGKFYLSGLDEKKASAFLKHLTSE